MPEPLADTATVVPLAFAPRAMLPLLAVVDKDNVPEALMAPVVLSPALLASDMLLPVELPIFKAVPLAPTQVTLPEVLKVKLLVMLVKVVILAEPEVRLRLVAAIEPAV